MPAWNEADGIEEFIRELHEHLKERLPEFIVVDDCSTDRTREVIEDLHRVGIRVKCHTNPRNLGHGPSTIAALRLGLASGASHVIALDGDGQFFGVDVERLVNAATTGGTAPRVVEGIRTGRSDAIYRKLLSIGTNILVWSRVRALPQDANTPLRVYESETLRDLISRIPKSSLIPNLHMSVLVRQMNVDFRMIPVRSRLRRGTTASGSTWGKVGRLLPNRRLVTFSLRALREWSNTHNT